DITGFCHVVALPDETIRVRYTYQGVVDQDTSSGLVHRVLTKDADIDQLSRDPVAEPGDGVALSTVLLKALRHDDCVCIINFLHDVRCCRVCHVFGACLADLVTQLEAPGTAVCPACASPDVLGVLS
ncbi:MAG: hypothetical protein AAF299_17670, partial [Pseudomonadota bacterium]